jgi:hypothetical protein
MISKFYIEYMTSLINFEDILPDDIVDLIYTKIVFHKPKELLEQLKYYHKILKYINMFKNNNIIQKNRYFQEILIVYYSILRQNNKYVDYNVNYVPTPIWNDIFFRIENSNNSEKKMISICIKYMLEIPCCHLKYLFKRNRPLI